MVSSSLQTPPGYSAARQGTVFYPLPQPGLLRITGPDRTAFLQRQTTNDLEQLAEGTCQVSVLVNPSARILDVLRVYSEDEALNAITLPGYAPATAQFLHSRIFFMDKVAVENISQAYIQVDLDGPEAANMLNRLGWSQTPEVNQLIPVLYEKILIIAIGHNGFNGSGFRLLIPVEAAENIFETMRQHGAVELSSEEYDILRVEAGIPAEGRELNGNFTPLEVGLEWAVSASKGCYTGQEVIARQVTYDKVTQSLTGLRLSAPIQPGTQLWKDGRPAGIVTSYAYSPAYEHVALGVVKRPFYPPGTILSAGSKFENEGEPAVVVQLPFQDDR